MSSDSSVKKNKLASRIKAEGFELCFPCDRCARLRKPCFKSSSSDRCNECVKAGGVRCTMPESSFSDAEWKRLVKAQNSLEEEEEVALAKLLRLRKHKRLLQKRAGDFIARDMKEIKELEELEEKERKAREEQEELQKQKERASEEAKQLAATSDDPADFNRMLEELSAAPSSFWENVDLSAGGIPSPSGGIHPNAQ